MKTAKGIGAFGSDLVAEAAGGGGHEWPAYSNETV